MSERQSLRQFFSKRFDLIDRYVGKPISIKIRLKNCSDIAVWDCDYFEKILLDCIAELRDAVFMNGGNIRIEICPFMYGGIAVFGSAYCLADRKVVAGFQLLISRDVICGMQTFNGVVPRFYVVA